MQIDFSSWTKKKRAIVQTTIELAGRSGFARVSTSKIARMAHVGEGTIYRHFKSKEDLFDVAAEMAASNITTEILRNYEPKNSVSKQYLVFCRDFLTSGLKNTSAHNYLQNYINSDQGKAYRRKIFLAIEEDSKTVRPLFYPLNIILGQAIKENLVKNFPLQLLAMQTIGQLIFVVRDGSDGLLNLDAELITAIAESCWDTVRK